MTWPTATKNAALDGQPFSAASLHSAFPGVTGSNEITGGSPAYARKAISMGAASGGVRSLVSAVTFDLPASTVRWVGFWNSTAFVGCAPNGGNNPRNFMSVASSDTFYSAGHGYIDGDTVVFYQGTPPGGITAGAVYYVRDAAADTFKVAATIAGTAIDLTSAPSWGCVVCKIVETTYASQAQHTLSTATFSVPD